MKSSFSANQDTQRFLESTVDVVENENKTTLFVYTNAITRFQAKLELQRKQR